MAIGAMKAAKLATVETEVAVTNGNDVAFELTTDNANETLPPGFWVTGVKVVPHDAATPKVAASTIWRLRFYTKYTKAIDEITYEDSRYHLPASSEEGLDKTEWYYENKDGVGSIYGTIGIDTGATDCSFTIVVDFDRRR